MRKMLPAVFFFLFWCVSVLLQSPVDVIPAVGFGAALVCLLTIKNKALSIGAAAAVCLGFCIYDISFLRYIPVLLLVPAHAIASVFEPKKNGKTSARRDGIYTLILLSVVLAAGILIADFGGFQKTPQHFEVKWLYGLFPGIAGYFVFLIWSGLYASGGKKSAARLTLGVCIAGAFGFLCSAVGFFLNYYMYDFRQTVFPWLLFLSVVSVSEDPVTRAFTDVVKAVTDRALPNGDCV